MGLAVNLESSRYELIKGTGVKHNHLICLNCGRVIDCSEFVKKQEELVKEMEKLLSKKYNFVIKRHQVSFYGLCDKCQGGD